VAISALKRASGWKPLTVECPRENAAMGRISYRIDGEKHVVYEKVTGRLTTNDMIKHADTMVFEPAHRPGMNFITDISEAEIDPSFEMLIELQNYLKRCEFKLGKFRWALIAGEGNNRAAAELCRSLATLADGNRIEIFTAQEEAERWVNLT
jgi:hypothetical protein